MGDDRLTALLEGREEGGLTRWRADRSVDEALAAARAAGWRADPVDLQGVADKAELMSRCSDGLGFPPWFGRNWDALRDLLADSVRLPEGARELVLVTGWRDYRAAAPEEWRVAERVFADAADRAARSARTLLVLLVEPAVTAPERPTPGTSG